MKNSDESDETQSEYYDHEAIRLRGQKICKHIFQNLQFAKNEKMFDFV